MANYRKFKIIWSLRILAVIDVLTSEKFELKSWSKNDSVLYGEKLKTKTTFDYNEIINSKI